MKIYYVDRIEENIIVCQGEDGVITQIDKDILPGAREGDCIVFDGKDYTVDVEKTQNRKEEMDSLLNDLFG